jgi:hypothetical protein
VYGDFSYTLKLNDTHRLALGLKAGVSFHKVGLRDIQSSLPDPSEGIFGEDINDASLNLGAGAFIIRINIMSLFNPQHDAICPFGL